MYELWHQGVTGVIVINGAGGVSKTTLDSTTTTKITAMVRSITGSVCSPPRPAVIPSSCCRRARWCGTSTPSMTCLS